MKSIIAALLLSCACVPSHVGIPSPSMATRARMATVVLTGEGRPFCSGVWVSDREILTAAHCVLGQDAIRYSGVEDASDFEIVTHPCAVYAIDESHDLALLHVLEPAPHVRVAIASEGPSPGESVHTMGAPYGLLWSYSRGEVAAVRVLRDPDIGEVKYVQATTPVAPGSSGGALFDASGKLVGIARGRWRNESSLNLFVHVDHVRQFLATYM